ncbi:MAG TPA: tetratricopeptide repeat protein [Myxococcaceae bacterium]|jgi:tetratricopeptide (TPR) repeat protein
MTVTARWLFVTSAMLTACAHAPKTGAGSPGDTAGQDGLEVSLQLDPSSSEAVRAAWTAYGLGRAAQWTKTRGETRNDSGDDFSIELEGRRAALAVWKEIASGERDADLDLLAEVEAKGFLEEFVVLAFARPGWTVPPDAIQHLELDAFWPWALDTLQHREVKGGAATTPKNGKRWPDVPGADLPDPNTLMAHGEQTPCGSWRVLEDAVQRWRETARIDGLPVAARNPQSFLQKLGAVRGDPEFQRQGATWVDERVGVLHFEAGFCANEREDWEAAQRALEQAIHMLPTDTTARVELAHAYVKQRQPDRALAQLEVARRVTTNPCELARVWRKIGFAHFDLDQLERSREAYETSLAYEPGNQIALNELKLLRQLMSAPGRGQRGGTGVGYTHAPQVTTSCKPSP